MSSLRDLDRAAERRWPRLMGVPEAPLWKTMLASAFLVPSFMVAAFVIFVRSGGESAFGVALTAAGIGLGSLVGLGVRLALQDQRE